MVSPPLKGSDLLEWRRRLLADGGHAADLDWLLDLAAGLRWQDLQRLQLDPAGVELTLDCSLDALEQQWLLHRQRQIPLQHLVGRCPWRDLELWVSPDALIPRQETELLVDLAVARGLASPAPQWGRGRIWADLGTGSGALAVALARQLSGWQGHAVDCSAAALALARRNLEAWADGMAWQLHQGSWWQPLRPWWGQLDLVVSNPPYIPAGVVDQLDPVVRDHEPRLALDGGSDGLDCCRLLLDGAAEALAPGGWLLLEHHHDQSEAVLALMTNAGLRDVQAAQDLEGIRRFALARRAAG